MGIEAFGLRPSHPLCYAMLITSVVVWLLSSMVTFMFKKRENNFRNIDMIYMYILSARSEGRKQNFLDVKYDL